MTHLFGRIGGECESRRAAALNDWTGPDAAGAEGFPQIPLYNLYVK